MHAIMIDNYDSFTYNLVQYLQELGVDVSVYRNDALEAHELVEKQPDFFVLSPGPSTPEEAGVLLELIPLSFQKRIPIFGVCLGHQAIGQAFGGRVVRAKMPVHGKQSLINHDETGIFRKLPPSMLVTRYHSLVVEKESLPGCLKVIAQTNDETIMGIMHDSALIVGVQFHPESVLTEFGKDLLRNFIEMVLAQKSVISSNP